MAPVSDIWVRHSAARVLTPSNGAACCVQHFDLSCMLSAAAWVAHCAVRACRAPDNPHQQIIKRMVAVEGDMVLMPDGSHDVQSIPKVAGTTALCCRSCGAHAGGVLLLSW